MHATRLIRICLLALLASVAAVAPALALCAACNATVRLDGHLAACFANRAPAELKALADTGKSMLIVDLNDCATRGSLPTGNDGDTPPAPLDLRFAADAAGIRCLADLIGAMDDAALDPHHEFDLTTDCPAN
ncbi:MAG: hypothetical protein ABI697_04675 [Devosia sp.]